MSTKWEPDPERPGKYTPRQERRERKQLNRQRGAAEKKLRDVEPQEPPKPIPALRIQWLRLARWLRS